MKTELKRGEGRGAVFLVSHMYKATFSAAVSPDDMFLIF